MARDSETIVKEIFKLVGELAELAGSSSNFSSDQRQKTSEKNNWSGPKGGIRFLIHEGKFNTPQTLPEIKELLKQDGRHYSNQAVSMGLLHLVRDRILTRLRTPGDKKWKYAIRK